ncbi:MAG: phytanoyl-CoA dioxygenase family protein [Rhodovibrionaceae bacterium]
MKLSESQVQEFDSLGCLFFPELFSAAEIATLNGGLAELLARRGPEVVREKDGSQAVRLVYGAHAFQEAYRRMSLHPRVLEPVHQLLREEAYIHQTRLNPKMDFAGGLWSWHQDFGTWHREDGMPEPHCLMVAVFLDDASAVNSPLLVIPGSQHHGMSEEVAPENGAQGYTVMEIDRAVVRRYAEEAGIQALTGPAGSVAFLHCNIVHGSAPNISPYRRAIWYLNYNAVSNACTGEKRDWHHCNRDFAPLSPLDDACLADLAGQAAV